MAEVIKYIKLPFSFSEEKLVSELAVLEEGWIVHFNKAHYQGGWSGLPLRSVGGSTDQVLAESHGSQVFADTPFMDLCPYIKSVTQQFPCTHRATRLLKLEPGALVKEHRDADLNFEKGEARIHVPITTNDHVEFYLDNEPITMLPGECWYMNFDLPHRLANYGNSPRVHLVMDMVLNDAVRAMLDQVGPPYRKMAPAKERFNPAEQEKIKEQLLRLGTPAALQLVADMESKATA